MKIRVLKELPWARVGEVIELDAFVEFIEGKEKECVKEDGPPRIDPTEENKDKLLYAIEWAGELNKFQVEVVIKAINKILAEQWKKERGK